MNMIEVNGLRVVAGAAPDPVVEIVKGVDFTVKKGEVLALIGESGSGKTTIALSLLGHARGGCSIAGGSVKIGGVDVLSLDEKGRRALRSRTVAYVAQSASAGFNPARTIMDQVTEPALLHKLMTPAAARTKAVDLFRALALPAPETIGARYPHQVSGGQLQRLMAAMALITDPAVVVFDEPTTALDVTTQIEVLAAFKRVVRELGTTAVYVSHDLAVVADGGPNRRVERRDGAREWRDGASARCARRCLHAPAARGDDASGARACVEHRERSAAAARNPQSERGLWTDRLERRAGRARARRREPEDRARGEVLLDGKPLPAKLSERTLDQYRRVQIVFQNADTALNPSRTIADILARPMNFYHGLRGAAAQKRMLELLDLVKLPASVAKRQPGGLSGGQKQRVNLARALAANPALILCDEVTSALDTVVGAAILDLLGELRRELGVSYMFISHHISTVRAICDEVIVLYAGQCVEAGQRDALSAPPYHPYTGLLIDSVPALRPGWLDSRRALTAGALPAMGPASDSHELCSFRARCTARIDGKCNVTPPSMKRLPSGAEIRCHHSAADLTRMQTADTVAA